MADKSQPPLKKQKSEETPQKGKSADEQCRRSSDPSVPTQSLQHDVPTQSLQLDAESVSPISTPSASSFSEIHPNQSDASNWTTRGVTGSLQSDITDDFSVTSSAAELERSDSTVCLSDLPMDPTDYIRFKQKMGVKQAKTKERKKSTSIDSTSEQEKPSTSKRDESSDESEEK